MSRYISTYLKELVAHRAKYQCEYCMIYSKLSYFPFHIEHIISIKHGGATVEENLALACSICNYNKGSDIASFVVDFKSPIRFYNPRIDIWTEHFSVDNNGSITSHTDIGICTIKVFKFNHPESIIERREMIKLGLL